jgi:hypothetical protein
MMIKTFNMAATIAMTLALTAPANAQLLGGAIGGGWASMARWAA